MDNNDDRLFFNGQVRLLTGLNEFGPSYWVKGFALVDEETGEKILPFISTFDLDKIVEEQDLLKITFRIYPDGMKQYQVELFPFLMQFKYEGKTYPAEQFYKTFTGEDY